MIPVNVGKADRVLRIVVGVILVVMVITGRIGPWGWFGLFMIGTAVLRRCPVYKLIPMDTLEENRNRINDDPRNRPH